MATAIEYGLIAALLGVAAVGGVTALINSEDEEVFPRDYTCRASFGTATAYLNPDNTTHLVVKGDAFTINMPQGEERGYDGFEKQKDAADILCARGTSITIGSQGITVTKMAMEASGPNGP